MSRALSALVSTVCVTHCAAGDAGQTEDQKLAASDAASRDNFGYSVAVSGTTAVMGAYDDDHSGLVDAGSAYVFDLTTGLEVAKLTASDAATGDNFGISVAVFGTTAVVAAFEDDHSGLIDAGSAYVFDLTTGEQVAKLTASDADSGDKFGSCIAVSGTTAVVGASRDAHSGLSNAGSAYVFDLTTGEQVAKLTASDAATADFFGSSVAVSGTTAVVGALRDDHSGLIDAGSAYVFDLTTGEQVAKLTASDAGERDQFGAVAVSGTTAVVGAPSDTHSGLSRAGSAYVFDLTTGQQVAKLIASDARERDLFGDVAVSGTTAVVGTDLADHSGLEDAGAAYVFDLSVPQPCPADFAPPFGTLDFADINAFVAAFVAQDQTADVEPDGVFDLADIVAFVTAFNAGCP